MKILLVDASKTMRSIERNVLNDMGYEDIVEVADGQDACDLIGRIAPNLLLVDHDLPTIDGLTFIRFFREKDKNTPIIMVSGESDKNRVVEAVMAGVNSYVVKPFSTDLLKQKIQEVIASN